MSKNTIDEQDVAKVALPDVIGFIVSEATDGELGQITDAIRQRQRALRALQAAAVSVGAQVRIKGLSPKYLNGLEGVVESITKSSGNVRLSKLSTVQLRVAMATSTFRGRFFVRADEEHYLLTGVPLSCCEVVQHEGS